MKLFTSLALGATATAMVLVNPEQQPLAPSIVQNPQSKSLIELAPYKTRWVTEEEKWSLKLVSQSDSTLIIILTLHRTV
jgi:leucyl aminopeptidase